MTSEIKIDRGRCVGIAMCESVDPDRFEVDDDGYLHVRRAVVNDDELPTAADAVRACPAVALALVES